jgi:NADP-dependent 3-hydroxy acid dehydrogenase YdfG
MEKIKVAFISGSTNGIGLAKAKEFIANGATELNYTVDRQ